MAGTRTCEGGGWFCLIYRPDENDYCKKCFEIEITEKKKAQTAVSEIIKNAANNKEDARAALRKIEAIWEQYNNMYKDYIAQNGR